MTAAELLAAAAQALADAGVPNPRVDAEWLLAHALGRRRDSLWLHPTHPVTPENAARFRDLLARRRAREPLQYILGTQEFFGRLFRVTPNVLIPRPETELLVEAALERCGPETTRMLDIGTGSGCIAVTLALERQGARITAIDHVPEALAIAAANAAAHGVRQRVTLLQADLRHALPDGPFDLLIANPPYCPAREWPTLQPEVRDFEPRGAVVGGEEGLDFLAAIIQSAPPRLSSGGWLALEIGEGQAETLRALCDRAGAFAATLTRRDHREVPRIVLAQRM
ncbi:MAG: peptide chain release factor N(5)-glutamine methyltransferase [Deltaproteobacteria bacterium]|nr:peptide chain release factor N(5)-glutamine methyltransferase [Deltaproteobacteria bacterium]